MALIELKTNLKSLKYQGIEKPLITKDINNPPKTGGISMQVNSRIDDTARLAKLLTKRQGLKFIGNQALLGQVGLKEKLKNAKASEDPRALGTALKDQIKTTVINTALSTASILAQVPVNGTGTHFIRGLKPVTYLKGGGSLLDSTTSAVGGFIRDNFAPNFKTVGGGNDTSQPSILENRPTQLASNLSKPGNELSFADPLVDGAGREDNNIKYVEGGQADTEYRFYQGNKATLGVESPKLTDPTQGAQTGDLKRTDINDIDRENLENINNSSNRVKRTSSTRPANYDTYLQNVKTIGTKTEDESRGLREEGLEDKPDLIQSIALDTQEITAASETDIIPFTFNVWTPGDTDGKFIYFRAFLDSLSDNYTGQWNSNKFIGRGDNLLTYNGFERAISFGFKIAAFSKADLNPLYEKLNYLVSSTAPTYSDGSFMKGTFVALTIGDYIVRQNGIIENIGLSWQTTYPWETESNENVKRVPHILDVQVSFKPIHSFLPKVGEKFIYQDA